MDQKSIVVADDEPAIVNAVKEILEKKGYRVYAALDGRHAVETVMRIRPDLVVLDIVMPEVHGYDVCRYLRGRSELKDLKILVLSSMSSKFDVDTAKQAGVDAYLTKPFTPEGLVEEVEKLLSEK